jgi:hypothetical protein
MNQLITLFIFFLISASVVAQDQPQDIEPNELKNSTQAQDNLKNDMAVAFAEKSVERQASEIEFAAWNLKLNEFLMASGDDFAQAMTLAKMVSNVSTASFLAELHENTEQVDAFKDLSYQPIADLVNQLINQAELSTQSFDVLTQICFSEEMIDHCHANVLLEKRMQQDSSNLQAYLRPFALAVKANNKKSMQQLIQLMAASQYSRVPLGINDTMESLIDAFIADNPIPQSAVDNLISDYQQLSGISSEKKAQLDELMPAYMPTFIKFSFNYLNDVPPYKPLLQYCQSNLSALSACRDISEVMIQNSNSMIDKGVGHSLLIATYELERNQAGINAAQQLNEKFRNAYECVRDLTQDTYFIDNYFDPEYQKINLTSTDELETLIKLADMRFQKLTAQGDETAVDPDSCFAEG